MRPTKIQEPSQVLSVGLKSIKIPPSRVNDFSFLALLIWMVAVCGVSFQIQGLLGILPGLPNDFESHG
jgi:hypothetical protein